MMEQPSKVGLLAGVGRLPVEFARAARGMGIKVIAIGLVSGVDPELQAAADKYYAIGAGKLSRIIATLKAEDVRQVTMLGKVTKEMLYTFAALPDVRLLKLLAGLKDFSDDTLQMAFVNEFAGEGITVFDQTAFLKSLMPGAGVLTRRAPNPDEQADMDFGLAMAKRIGALDIGQTVVVKQRAVMAVEAIEGTDACIRRGGALSRGGATVAKAAKPNQDSRFDVPSIGPDTIRAMAEAGATALVIEAGATFVVSREETVALADKHGITIVAKSVPAQE